MVFSDYVGVPPNPSTNVYTQIENAGCQIADKWREWTQWTFYSGANKPSSDIGAIELSRAQFWT